MEIINVFKQALMITFFVFVMMLIVDFVDTMSKKRLSDILKGGRWRQYALTSFLGSTPGCLGAFMNVSLYIHGMISFGAVVGGMIATSGDEAFVMLVQFPGTAVVLFLLLFISGILCGWISDKVIKTIHFIPCETCFHSDCEQCMAVTDNSQAVAEFFKPRNFIANIHYFSFTRFLLVVMMGSFLVFVSLGILGPTSWNWKRATFTSLSVCALYITMEVPEHYLHVHIWGHILKKHLFRVFFWSFGALLFVHYGLKFWSIDAFIHQHLVWILIIGAILGIIPESGPHLIFVMMYAKGLVPFSVIFTTSFIQDGHGMLPLLSYSLRDSVLVKTFNFVFGLSMGSILFMMGL